MLSSCNTTTVFSKRSAELVFEDLAISGWHPTQLRPILRSCSYPPHQMEELLREGDSSPMIKTMIKTQTRSNLVSMSCAVNLTLTNLNNNPIFLYDFRR